MRLVKLLHRDDLWGWSQFDESRNVDFNATFWRRARGNVVVDPMPMSEHDVRHMEELGGVSLIVITNSDHIRASADVAARFGARIAGPRAEEATFPFRCDRWIGDEEEVVPGLIALELRGSKTPGELALLLESTTLLVGDLVRCHQAGRLHRLPDAKLKEPSSALSSIRRLAELPNVDAVLTGDGWPMFEGGHAALRSLAAAE